MVLSGRYIWLMMKFRVCKHLLICYRESLISIAVNDHIQKVKSHLSYKEKSHPESKRSAVKLLSSVLVLAFLYLYAMTSASPSPTVIIIGAGMSGILAAKTLHDSGIQDILILEANSKIGGRIHSVQFRGHTVELGANWVIGGGPRSNHLYEIASKLNLKTYFSDYGNISANIYKQEGGLYPKHVVSAALEVAETRDQFCTSFSTRLSASGHNHDDVSILVSQRLFKEVPTTPLDMVIDYFYNDYEDAEPPRVTSLKNTIPRYEFLDFGDQTYFLADSRGFESILIYIAKQFLSHKHEVIRDQRLMLNKVVREINYSKCGVQVKTEDGSMYQAKYVIVSVSVGVLQSDLIVFKPHLPQWKTQAIYEFDMAVYTKIFLKFPSKFWPSGPETEFFLYAHEKRGYYPIWQHLETELPGSNILFVTVTDEEAKRIEQQPDIKIQEEIMDVLKKMFGNDIPEPEEILIPRWWSNRFFKGSFSNWPIGYSQRRHMQLKEPVGRIYFCGEHTYSRYLGYADAAYFAGIETANHLIKCLKHEKYCNGHDRHSTIDRLNNEDPYDPDV